MKNENNTLPSEPVQQPDELEQKPKSNVLITVVAVVASALLVGGGVYFWQSNELATAKTDFQKQNTELQQQSLSLETEVSQLQTQLTDLMEKVEDSKTDSVLTKIREEGDLVYYQGSITLSGKYQEYKPGTLMGGELCFYADDLTGDLIPRDPNLFSEGVGDERDPWFCVNNKEVAKSMLGINDEEVFGGGSVECIQGNATIVVSDYIVNKKEAAVFDTATLDQIVTKTAYSTQCD